jgi:hypothetical protein
MGVTRAAPLLPAARRRPPLPCISRRRDSWAAACREQFACPRLAHLAGVRQPAEPDQHTAPARGGDGRCAQSTAPTRPLRLRPICCRRRSATPGRPRPLALLRQLRCADRHLFVKRIDIPSTTHAVMVELSSPPRLSCRDGRVELPFTTTMPGTHALKPHLSISTCCA